MFKATRCIDLKFACDLVRLFRTYSPICHARFILQCALKKTGQTAWMGHRSIYFTSCKNVLASDIAPHIDITSLNDEANYSFIMSNGLNSPHAHSEA